MAERNIYFNLPQHILTVLRKLLLSHLSFLIADHWEYGTLYWNIPSLHSIDHLLYHIVRESMREWVALNFQMYVITIEICLLTREQLSSDELLSSFDSEKIILYLASLGSETAINKRSITTQTTIVDCSFWTNTTVAGTNL